MVMAGSPTLGRGYMTLLLSLGVRSANDARILRKMLGRLLHNPVNVVELEARSREYRVAVASVGERIARVGEGE